MSNTVRLLLVAIALTWMYPGAVKSQNPASAQDRPIRLTTDLIEVRAVVTDKRGNPIRGLVKEDFELLENGQPQPISFFSLEELTARSGTAPTASDVAPSHPASSTTTSGRTIVLFADTIHLSNESFLRTKQMLRHFINEQLRSGDLVGVISSGGPMGLFNQFTRDRRVMLQAVGKLSTAGVAVRRSRFTPYIASMVQREDREAIRLAIQIINAEEGDIGGSPAMVEAAVKLRARTILSEASRWRGSSLQTLDAVLAQLAALPGQRLVFYVSEGFSLMDNAGMATGELHKVTSRAVRHGILIYSLDGKGLDTDPVLGEVHSQLVLNPIYSKYTLDSIREAEGSINALAKDTGGDAFFNSNDFSGSMKQALADNSVYYALAYYPPAEKGDNKYRRITVRVKNHPEYNVRAQKGYLPPDPKAQIEMAKQTTEQKMLKAIAAPLPATGIGVAASAYYVLQPDRDVGHVSIEVFIDGTSLQYSKQGGRDVVDCELTTVVFDQTGKSTKVVTDKVRGALTPEQLALARRQGYRYVKQFELKPGIYQARVGVRENGSELMGTANTWVEVPNLRRTGVALSSLLLNRVQTEDDKKSRGDGPELFAPGIKQGIATFKQGASLAYQFTVYDKTTRRPEELSLLVQSEVTQGEKPLYRSDWKPVNERLQGVSTTGFDVGGQINLDVKPGIYELRIIVKNSKTKRTVEQAVMFEVL